jgi:hypothetical protein
VTRSGYCYLTAENSGFGYTFETGIEDVTGIAVIILSRPLVGGRQVSGPANYLYGEIYHILLLFPFSASYH